MGLFLFMTGVGALIGWLLVTIMAVVVSVYGAGIPPENLVAMRWLHGSLSIVAGGFALFLLGAHMGKKP